MELFERIRYLSENKNKSLSKIAIHVGVTPQAFNKWLKLESEHNLWNHLPKILELFPDVREEWLFIGREPAFKDGTAVENQPTREEVEALKAENERLNAELNEERALNRKLTARLLVESTTDKAAVTATARAAGQE